MHVHAAGSGPAILLLHAFPLDGRMWNDQIRRLTREYLVLAPDIAGFGLSPRPDGNPSLDEWARDILAACKARGIDRAVVAGCSMGGYLAFAMLRCDSDFATALGLFDTRAVADSQDVRRTRYEMVERARHEGTAFLQATDPPLSPATIERHPEVVAAVKRMMADATPVGVMAAQRAMASRRDSRSILGGIRVPTTVLWGNDDPVVPRAEAEEMAAAIADARFEEIPDCGHLAPIERPEIVTEVLWDLASRAATKHA